MEIDKRLDGMKPCPFCGGENIDLIPMDFDCFEIEDDMAPQYDIPMEIIEEGHMRFCEELEIGQYIVGFALSCKGCGATLFGDTIGEVREKWNRRSCR